jgi:hypothetical protein
LPSSGRQGFCADGGDPGQQPCGPDGHFCADRGILDSIATRLDEARDISHCMSRYMTGLLVFLGLLGTFWGLIEAVTSVGCVI